MLTRKRDRSKAEQDKRRKNRSGDWSQSRGTPAGPDLSSLGIIPGGRELILPTASR